MHESGCRDAQVVPRGNGAGRPATRQAMNGLFRIISLPVHSFGADFEGAMQNSIGQITAIMDIEGASGSKMYIGLEVEMRKIIGEDTTTAHFISRPATFDQTTDIAEQLRIQMDDLG